VELMAGGQAARGHQVQAVLLLDPLGDPPPIAAALQAAGVEVTEVRAPARHYWKEARAIAECLRRSGATIVHSHAYRADVLSFRPARKSGAALVATAHGITGNDLKNRVYEWLDRQLLRRFDIVVAVSEPLRGRLIKSGVDPGKVRVIENGVGPAAALSREEARRELGLPATGRSIGWIGRMTREKGADLLVEALKPVAGRLAEVVVVGDGPERGGVEAAAGPGFRFLGLVPDASRYVAAFDALVISSRSEGTPMVLLEAMQAGVPVAAFAVGGIPEVLKGESGWPVPPGDLSSLRDAVEQILADRHRAAVRAEAARQRIAARFGLQGWLDRLDLIYAEVDRRRGP
jgi:glycosyltransferase involved in cell wall biosynthesis